MTESHSLETGLDALTRRISDARASLAAGTPPDLSGMDAEANRLVAGIAALPEGEGAALAPRVERVIEALDALAAALGETEAGSGGRSVARADRVAAAYGGGPGRMG